MLCTQRNYTFICFNNECTGLFFVAEPEITILVTRKCHFVLLLFFLAIRERQFKILARVKDRENFGVESATRLLE